MTNPAGNPARCLAGIVIYHPPFAALQSLVSSLADDVSTVAIYANSPVSGEQQQALEEAAGSAELMILRPGLNRGLGAAYNAFCHLAKARDSEFLLLLDQDSTPEPGMAAALMATHRRLASCGEKPAIVGPQPIAPEGKKMRLAIAARAGQDEPLRTRFVISSGSLIRLSALAAIGDFRSDYFIDAIDIEWCLRAVAAGYSIWVDPAVPMPHRLGQGVIRLPLGLLLTNQPPRRLYTYIRNQLAMLRLRHVPARHKIKFLVSLPVRLAVYLAHHRFSSDCVAALANGLRDGVLGRMGPPDRALIPVWRLGRNSRATAPRIASDAAATPQRLS
ncbi:rhamnosyl transferase [Bosea sp. (in: a-proteobacteria)]|jgi:rhamnosyltransferase|uniref:rhamnosyl transferase n=1 Tax=Bosea sp. (in: a-proteobacteria) TaxID=1871050 RepID=UPI002DDCE10C|nr:rhamnosyl transferase [Bosea sp. (in: a-proteobacteria)]HEV2510842.1 rhamnosyl transferase [Bosea sp. (in: a-proteobacteria)]